MLLQFKIRCIWQELSWFQNFYRMCLIKISITTDILKWIWTLIIKFDQINHVKGLSGLSFFMMPYMRITSKSVTSTTNPTSFLHYTWLVKLHNKQKYVGSSDLSVAVLLQTYKLLPPNKNFVLKQQQINLFLNVSTNENILLLLSLQQSRD